MTDYLIFIAVVVKERDTHPIKIHKFYFEGWNN